MGTLDLDVGVGAVDGFGVVYVVSSAILAPMRVVSSLGDRSGFRSDFIYFFAQIYEDCRLLVDNFVGRV